MFNRLWERLRGHTSIDHAQTRAEREPAASTVRGPNARTDPWYSGPVSDKSFVDEGRPRR